MINWSEHFSRRCINEVFSTRKQRLEIFIEEMAVSIVDILERLHEESRNKIYPKRSSPNFCSTICDYECYLLYQYHNWPKCDRLKKQKFLSCYRL